MNDLKIDERNNVRDGEKIYAWPGEFTIVKLMARP